MLSVKHPAGRDGDLSLVTRLVRRDRSLLKCQNALAWPGIFRTHVDAVISGDLK